MYAGDLLNNLDQHTNIDHNNDVDNHVIIFIYIHLYSLGSYWLCKFLLA